MAGSKVSAPSSTRSTADMAPIARPSMKGRPTTNRPSSDMTTVPPANMTARPAVDSATTVAVARVAALRQPLPVAGDDEQGVVDADAEADHGHQLRTECRHGQDVAEQVDDAEADRDPDERGDDRQAHGHDRSEGHEHDDDGGRDSDAGHWTPVSADTTSLIGLPPRETANPGWLKLRATSMTRLTEAFGR